MSNEVIADFLDVLTAEQLAWKTRVTTISSVILC